MKSTFLRRLLVTTLTAWSLGAQDPDISNLLLRPPESSALHVGMDGTGNLYQIGCVEKSGTFPVNSGERTHTAAVFVRKFSPDGATVLLTSILGQVDLCGTSDPRIAARVDQNGNIFVVATIGERAFPGVANWKGSASGTVVLVKYRPQADQIEFATRFPSFGWPARLALDSDGSALVSYPLPNGTAIAKVLPSGEPAPFTYEVAGDASGLISVGSDHSIYFADITGLYKYSAEGKGRLSHTPFRIDPGKENAVRLKGLAIDRAGNAYVAGSVFFADGNPPGSIKPVDFSRATTSASYGFLAGFNATGELLFQNAFHVTEFGGCATAASGDIWLAGISIAGIHVFSTAPDGESVRHHFAYASFAQVPATGINRVSDLLIDTEGRPVVVGHTSATRLPDLGAAQDRNGASGPVNAFLLRSDPRRPPSDLRLTIEAPPLICGDCRLTYKIRITNRGQAAAKDVFLKFPEANRPTTAGLAPMECLTDGTGYCTISDTQARLVFPAINPGESVTAEYTLRTPQFARVFQDIAAMTATDNPVQIENRVHVEVPVQTHNVMIAGAPPAWLYEVGGIRMGGAGRQLRGVPLTPNAENEIYVPTPQDLGTQDVWEFISWDDGVTDNPRNFQIGATPPQWIGVRLRRIFEPWISPDGAPVFHAGSYRSGGVVPGEVIVLFGRNLGASTLVSAKLDTSGRVATELAGFKATFDGVPAPLIYTNGTSVSLIVPYGVAGADKTTLLLSYNKLVSTPIDLEITKSEPGLFTRNSQGIGLLAAFNAGGILNSLTTPARPGEIITVFGSGEGITIPSSQDGLPAGSEPPHPAATVSVTIGGEPARITYVGGVPTVTAGIFQINVEIPTTVARGTLPVVVTVAGVSSQRRATIAVQ